MNWLTQLSDWMARLRFWFVVRPWEQGLRVRCGRWIVPAEKGLHWCMPFLDEVFVQSTRLRVLNLPIQTITSKAGKTVTVSGVVKWRVFDVRRMYERLHTPEDWIYNAVLTAIADEVYKADHDLGPEELGALATSALRGCRSLGVRVKGVAITDLAFVRTYRLISGEGNSGWSWDRLGALDTQHGHKVGQ